MSLFKSKKQDEKFCGMYAIYDPKIPSCKFSPPFFSANDTIASQALLETLRRRTRSFEDLYASEFLRMDLWRIGSVRLNDAKVICSPLHRYKICNVGEYLSRDFVRNYLKNVPFHDESEV